jgi:hypothetical protein
MDSAEENAIRVNLLLYQVPDEVLLCMAREL